MQVCEPQTVSSTFSSYTTYLIKSSINDEGVRRRYSDFDWLRDVLVARYHGLGVPLMPEKRLVGNQGSAFIEERMQGLENFMLLVLANPYLRNDVTLRMFLTQKGAAEFEQAKKAASQGVGADPSTNAGLARWFGVLRQLPLPVDADAACTELSAHCDETEAKLVAALAAITRYYECAKALSDSIASVHSTLNDLQVSATAASTSLSETLAAVRKGSATLGSRVKRTADAFSNTADLSKFAPNEIQLFLLDGFVTEVHRLRGLKALLAVRAGAQDAYSKAWVNQDKLQFQAKQFREKARPDKADALEPKIAEAVGIMRRMRERLDDISKGLLNIEADRVSRVRVERMIAMSGQYAALCIASGVRAQELWSNFLGSMELDQSAMVHDAQDTLTGKSSMHTLDCTGPSVSYICPGAALTGSPPIVINGGAAGAAAAAGGASAAGGAAASGSSEGGAAMFSGSSGL